MAIFLTSYSAEKLRDDMPPACYRIRTRAETWPWPLPPFIRLTNCVHLQVNKVVDTAHRFHGEFRDRLEVPLLRAIGVPESTVTSFRDWNIQVQKNAYGFLRGVHWYG